MARFSVVRRSESRLTRSSDASLTNARSHSAKLWRIFTTRSSHQARLGGDGRLGALVDGDEAQVVLCDLAGAGGSLDLAVDVCLERVPPDRAADGEADVAVDGRGGLQPLVDLGVVGAAAEHDAPDVVAAAGAGLGDEHFAIGALV